MYSVMDIPLRFLRQGKFSAERAKEQDIPLKYWNPLQKGQTIEADGITYTPEMVLGPAEKRNQAYLYNRYQTNRIYPAEMQRNRICLSVKECTEKMTKQTKHAVQAYDFPRGAGFGS